MHVGPYTLCTLDHARWIMHVGPCTLAKPLIQMAMAAVTVVRCGDAPRLCFSVFRDVPSEATEVGQYTSVSRSATAAWPTKALLLPGNGVVVEMNASTCYLEGDDPTDLAKHFGFRCLVTGYTWRPPSSVLHSLENEFVHLFGTCISRLLTPSNRALPTDAKKKGKKGGVVKHGQWPSLLLLTRSPYSRTSSALRALMARRPFPAPASCARADRAPHNGASETYVCFGNDLFGGRLGPVVCSPDAQYCVREAVCTSCVSSTKKEGVASVGALIPQRTFREPTRLPPCRPTNWHVITLDYPSLPLDYPSLPLDYP
jgi:hypothetical protein